MVVSERAINNIMGGMENTAGVRLHSHRHKLKQRFDIIRKLGQGTYGKVQLAINKETGQEVAIKTIKKAKIETEQDLVRIRREIQIMSSVQHPQIIHIYEVFENREKMVLVMEYAAGGELYDYLSERKVLQEDEARRVFRQVASAVYYCHKHKICHRDLKLENILLDIEGNAKIADFGLSNVFDDKQRLDTFCGSPLYASPEIVKGVPYVGPEVDCWSLGVLLYTLVYGAMPFDGTNFRRLVKQITQGDFYEPATPASASELIRQMLTTQSQERANIEDICSHWWVNEGYPVSCLTEAEDLANQTPVRLDLLLSLAPKQISTEHMLIQPEEEENQPLIEEVPQIKIPPPPPVEEAMPETDVVLNQQPPRSVITSPVDTRNTDKETSKKKTVANQKPPSIPPTEEDKKVTKKKETATTITDKEKSKKREASPEREKSKVKKRDVSVDRERPKAKSREVSTDRSTKDKPKEQSGGSPKIPASPERKTDQKSAAVSKAVAKSTEKMDAQEQSVRKRDTSASRNSMKKSTQPNENSKVKPSPKQDSTAPKPTTTTNKNNEESNKISPKPDLKTTSNNTDELEDTEKILKETAAKIENVERLMNEESKRAESQQPLISPSKDVPSATTTSSRNSISSSHAPTPVRSRAGSESSGETSKPGSRSDSRRQSKILSKAAIFEAGLSQSSSTEKNKKSTTTRPGTLNINDLAKRFEEKPAPEKKNRVVTPCKVSDARKAFEGKNEANSRRVSTGGNGNAESSPASRKSSISSPSKGGSSPSSANEQRTVQLPGNQSPKTANSVNKETTENPSKDNTPEKVEEKLSNKEPSPLSDVSKSSNNQKIDSNTSKRETKPQSPKAPTEIQPSSDKTKLDAAKSTVKQKSSESSESESETERVLKEVAEKRKLVEKTKKAKLKSVADDSISKNDASRTKGQNEAADEEKSKITNAPLSSPKDNNAASVKQVDVVPKQTSAQKPSVRRIPVVKEVVPIPPEQVLSPTPRTPTDEPGKSLANAELTGSSGSVPPSSPPTKKSQVEIVLKKQSPQRPPSATPVSSNASKQDRTVAPVQKAQAHPEPHLQRAPRERIIPIMLEDEANESSRTSSLSSVPKGSDSVVGGGHSQQKTKASSNVESIKKSRRERIIPIAVEGEGLISPVLSDSSKTEANKPFYRNTSSHGSFSRGYGVERADSFSSAGEDDDDEDDGFQILTAESLFSTLLSRVRSLTRKMATDHGRILPINHVGHLRHDVNPSSSSDAPDGPGSGAFWSSLYTPHRDNSLANRDGTGGVSRGNSRERDLFGEFNQPFCWGRTSRDGSDADSNVSEQSGPFSTLPRADLFRQPSLNWHHHKLIRDRFFSDFTRT